MSDPEGNPVPGFSLWLRNEDLAGMQPNLVTGDAKGYFTVDEVLAGELTFATRSEPFISIRGIKLQPNDNLKLRLIIDWGDYVLYGQVMDSFGVPISQAGLSLSWNDNSGGLSSRSTRNATSDSDGYFLFTRLGTGPHQLRISAPGFRSAELDYTVGVATEGILVVLEEEN